MNPSAGGAGRGFWSGRSSFSGEAAEDGAVGLIDRVNPLPEKL